MKTTRDEKTLVMVALAAITFGFCAATISSVCRADDEAKVSIPEITHTSFDSMDDAAKAAEHDAMQLSNRFEYGGAVYQQNGKFFYTSAITQHDSHAVDYRVALPKSAKVVAIYHTHPDSSDYGDAFSISDIQTAKKMNLVMYVGVVVKGHVLKFNPSKDHVVVNFTMTGPAPFYPQPL